MDKFLHIRSKKFLPVPGEEEEMVNDGMYGKALSIYFQEKLKDIGYDVPFYCCEDWGWWIEIKGKPFAFGVSIYSGKKNEEAMEYAVCDGVTSDKKWSWSRLKFIKTMPYSEKLLKDLQRIIEEDEGIDLIGITTDCPVVNE